MGVRIPPGAQRKTPVSSACRLGFYRVYSLLLGLHNVVAQATLRVVVCIPEAGVGVVGIGTVESLVAVGVVAGSS